MKIFHSKNISKIFSRHCIQTYAIGFIFLLELLKYSNSLKEAKNFVFLTRLNWKDNHSILKK